MDYIVLDGKKYADDKPKECRYCYFWENKKVGCIRGEERCYYLWKEPAKKVTECSDCPYGKTQTCVGWCTKKILQDSKKKERR